MGKQMKGAITLLVLMVDLSVYCTVAHEDKWFEDLQKPHQSNRSSDEPSWSRKLSHSDAKSSYVQYNQNCQASDKNAYWRHVGKGFNLKNFFDAPCHGVGCKDSTALAGLKEQVAYKALTKSNVEISPLGRTKC